MATKPPCALPNSRRLAGSDPLSPDISMMHRATSLPLEVPQPLQEEVGVSVVMPCLNEEETVGECVREALMGLRRSGVSGEVLVVDNGSFDRSVEVAYVAG